MVDIGSRNSTSEVRCRVPLGPSGGNGIPEHLAGIGQRPMRIFKMPSRLDAAQGGKQFRRGYFSNGSRANPREEVSPQSAGNALHMTLCPLMLEFFEPLLGHGLKGIVTGAGSLENLFDKTGINTLGKLLFRQLRALSRF